MKNKYFLISKNIFKNLGKDTCQRIFIMAKWSTVMCNIWKNGNMGWEGRKILSLYQS